MTAAFVVSWSSTINSYIDLLVAQDYSCFVGPGPVHHECEVIMITFSFTASTYLLDYLTCSSITSIRRTGEIAQDLPQYCTCCLNMSLNVLSSICGNYMGELAVYEI